MSNGKLKAQYNRVRTSVALQSNSIWTSTIGLENEHKGANSAVEASLRAPTHGGGGGRAARRQAAQDLIQAAGYEPAVTSYEGLVALARAQGTVGSENRGACKLCGGLGHLTKQCRNFLSKKVAATSGDPTVVAVAAATSLPLLPPEDEGRSRKLVESSSSSGLSSDLSLTDSSSDSDSSDSRRKRKKHKKHSKDKSKGEKKRRRHKETKSRRHKKKRKHDHSK